MKKLIEKEKSEKGKALFEIFLLVISIAAFSYFIGNELEVVSASGCVENWNCGDWSNKADSCGTRTCTDSNRCGTTNDKPETSKTCPSPAPSFVLCSSHNILAKLCESGQTCSGTVMPSDDAIGGKTCCVGDCKDAEKPLDLGWLYGLGGTTISSLVKPAAAATVKTTVATGAVEAGKLTVPLATEVTKKAATTGLEWGKIAWGVENGWFTIAANAAIAVGFYFLVKGIGTWLFPDYPKLFNYLAWGAALGYGAGSLLGLIFPNTLAIFGLAGTGFGLIFAAVFMLGSLLFYTEEYVAAVQFTCSPWQPETGGAKCGECNKGELGCTPYKCQSLGQACELLNPDTDEQVCYWVDENNIAPPLISSWDGPLDKEKYAYAPDTARLPPDKGVIIKYIGPGATVDGAIPAFSRIDFGISLDIPGACRVALQRKISYEEMTNPGDISQGYYISNHTLSTIHSGAVEAKAEGIPLPNGGVYEIFIRCQSKQGHSNVGTFVFKYKVQSEPDITAPEIKSADPPTGMPMQFEQPSKNIYLYVNKPSECRWSHNDEDYNTMAGRMTGPTSIGEIGTNMLFTYSATLTGLKDGVDNLFYFRCKSYPENAEKDRYKNEESYPYKLIGTRPLVLDSVSPASGTVIKDATESVKVTLTAKTSAGYNNGQAKCSFKKTSESDQNYVFFRNTNSYQSSQDLWLPKGSYKYTINCCDLGGNCASKATDFTVDTDFYSPIISRAYNEGDSLKVVTTESAECVYDTTSCSYTFEDGLRMTTSDNINHFTEWNTDSNFYIKCKDEFGNQPLPDGCSIVIRPFSSG